MSDEKKTILIVDDSPIDRNMLSQVLSKKTSFCILEAENGTQCMDIIEREKIDLVLMDIMMPEKSGDAVLKSIREKFNAVEIPIIMVTGKQESNDIVDCLQKGANDYIVKPIHFDIAISRILTHLRISCLSQEMAKLKQMIALDAMITTYNHEINNPLSIALCALYNAEESEITPKLKEKIHASIWRIANIVKKIENITNQKEIHLTDYTEYSKMLDLKHIHS